MMTSKHVFNIPVSGASLRLRLVIFDSSFFPVSKVQELAKLIEDFCIEHQEDVVARFESEAEDIENDLSYWQSK